MVDVVDWPCTTVAEVGETVIVKSSGPRVPVVAIDVSAVSVVAEPAEVRVPSELIVKMETVPPLLLEAQR